MPPFNSAPRALARLVALRNPSRRRTRDYPSFSQVRPSSNIAGNNAFSPEENRRHGKYGFLGSANSSRICNFVQQKRGFLGCGDGEEGGMLSKVHQEKRVLGYSPEQLFNVVAAVDMYEDFLPWCQRSQIICQNPDGSFDAELEIGFKFLVESYTSHVELTKPKSIKTTSSQTSLFEHLINVWEFSPGPVPGSCSLYFMVDFKFQSPLYRQVANMFFKEVVSRLVGSFNDRCRLIYGPGVQVLENSYNH
ncbi:coenzyme Q-binding protein COQ10 homolog, mitochondrial-like [Salvia hispanica]|uniref:coenzyme Q-binding protein COQ10 homolog, mitochondrial-like n=1 Tax=Salvia hispanica TaxID=49212 RepID=UPI0020096DE5|nr:coenzyme Q-binding protein COQ10 homolog, mitochondrial-like [Salvia hispanica]